jgi:hypothetical protein
MAAGSDSPIGEPGDQGVQEFGILHVGSHPYDRREFSAAMLEPGSGPVALRKSKVG